MQNFDEFVKGDFAIATLIVGNLLAEKELRSIKKKTKSMDCTLEFIETTIKTLGSERCLLALSILKNETL